MAIFGITGDNRKEGSYVTNQLIAYMMSLKHLPCVQAQLNEQTKQLSSELLAVKERNVSEIITYK